MKKVWRTIALFLFCASPLHGEEVATVPTPPSIQKATQPHPYVNTIRISGNKAISEEELRLIISTRAHKSFFGSGLFGGAKKAFNAEEFERDIFLIKKLYTYKGYFAAEVDTTITRLSKGKKVNLAIRIKEHQPARIDTLRYFGLEKVPERLEKKFLAESRLQVGKIFSVEQLIEERDRSLNFFREQGYTFFHEDSIRVKVDTVGTHAGIAMNFHLPERLQYAPIHAVVQNSRRNEKKPREQTFQLEGIHGKVIGRQRINPELITTAVAFRQGQYTSQSKEQRTLQNLGATNVFSSLSITPDSVRSGLLYTTISLEAAPKHELAPKILVDNRYGPLFFGGSMAYENKNLLGRGEQLRLSANYGTQIEKKSSLLSNLAPSEYDAFNPYDFSVKSTLVRPVSKQNGNYYSTTIEYATTKQPVLLSNRNALIRATYNAKLGSTSRLNFDFFDVEWVQKDSLRGFKPLFQKELATNIGIDPTNDAAINAGIDSLVSTHFNQTFRLRYQSKSKPRSETQIGRTLWNTDLLLEESGSLAWLVDRYLDTSRRNGFTSNDPQIFGTAYSQYLKLESGVSFVNLSTTNSQFAGRIRAGWMAPYGKATATPEERRFYAGGANDLRGWIFGTLGPGKNRSEATANFGANIKLTTSLEYRLKFFRFLNQPSGITFFTDAGNIWDNDGTYGFNSKSLFRDMAWDAGAGLRLGSPIGPLRFDIAYRLHDPTQAHPWQLKHLNGSDYTFTFGIGEAF
uniref:POTRA domain-containing protein n=1 Tax=Chlorobium chlorochromatii (strain CaD3) TaxID=340177 RepID=Q3AU71_CHLCH